MALGIDRNEVLSELSRMAECIPRPPTIVGSSGPSTTSAAPWNYLDGRPLPEVALHLAETPCSPIGMNRPKDATRDLFARSWNGPNTPNLRLVKG